MVDNKGLDVRELLKNTYDRLLKKHSSREIVFPIEVLAEIANDSDYHRTRVGYMGYKSAGLFQFNNKTWAIARGEKRGSYPADPYDSDILTLPFSIKTSREEKIRDKLKKDIENNYYFRNSLIVGMADGIIGASQKNKLATKLFEIIGHSFSSFISQKLEYHSELFYLDLQPAVKSPMLYKQEFVDFLANTIHQVLKEN